MNFDDEFEVLWVWFQQKIDEYKKAPVRSGYLDSEATEQFNEYTAEYNRRLDSLNEKYGRNKEQR